MTNEGAKKVGLLSVFSVASVWFGSHAGGGFATGNQAHQYFIQYGWYAPIMAVAAMAILGFVLKECMVMTNNHGFTNYKQVFEELYAPYVKMEIIFEIFFFIVALSATGAAIAGAATLFTEAGINYYAAVVGISVVLFFLTIFGSSLVAKASTIMSVFILVCCAIIFYMGVQSSSAEITRAIATQEVSGSIVQPLLKVLSYSGFQVLCAPALIGCASALKTRKNCTKAALLGFVMNAFALGFSCLMLLGWSKSYMSAGGLSLPTLYVCNQLGMPALYYCYTVSLFLCFISTGVTSIFGLVPRFENISALKKIKDVSRRRMLISLTALIVSTLVSLVGLSNIVKYAYVWSGYLSTVFVVIPMLTIGHYKNKKWAKEHPEIAIERKKAIASAKKPVRDN